MGGGGSSPFSFFTCAGMCVPVLNRFSKTLRHLEEISATSTGGAPLGE